MAIPFFRKDRNKPDKEASQKSGDDAGDGMTTFGSVMPDEHGIMVEEVGGAPEGALDEAAVFYASNQIANAEQTLKGLLQGSEPRAWHMLFDLYRLTQREAEFEQLALDYAVKFETSPPNLGRKQGKTPVAAKASKTLVADAKLDRGAGGRLKDEISAAATDGATLLLDLSRIVSLEPAGAIHLAAGLTKARKASATLQVSGGTQLVETLKGKLNSDRGAKEWWLLLLSVYQLLGRQTEFEDLAVDYAVHFEVSPPSWETVKAAEEISAPAEAESPKDGFALKGIVSDAAQNQIDALLQYAGETSEVVVDLSEVTRVDYAYIGSFISHLMKLLGTGKSITLQGQNSLVNELFRSMGIDQLARLEPAKLG